MTAAFRSAILAIAITLGPILSTVSAQQPAAAAAARTATGVVVSSSTAALILRNNDGEYTVFALDRDTARPDRIVPGSEVRVVQRDEEVGNGIPVADSVVTTAAPKTAQAAATQDPLPPSVRRLERQIERQARRYRLGGFAAIAMDPELITLGARGSIGPIFDRRFSFRPNLELGFGELTTMLSINLDGVYHLTRSSRSRWLPYVGAGVNLSYKHENLEREEGGRSFDFGDSDLDSGVNFIAGMQTTNNLFVELVSTVYSEPHLRVIVGVNFW